MRGKHRLVLQHPVWPAGDNPGRPFSASDLNRLPLLSAVIKESLRLCTPAPWGGTRHVVDEEGVELLGHHLPKVRLSRGLLCPKSLLLAPQTGNVLCNTQLLIAAYSTRADP